MKIIEENINNIPIILVYDKLLSSAIKKGSIIFFHGLGSSKNIQYNDLCKYAKNGYLAIGIDNWGHGDRKIENYDSYFDLKSEKFQNNYINSIQITANEIPQLITSLIDKHLISTNKIGISGISMGAIIGYRVIIIEKRISSATLFVGSPEWEIDLPESPHKHLSSFYPTALLSLVASKDSIVPHIHTKILHDNLISYYSKSPDRLKLIEYPESDHIMKSEDWDNGFDESIKWFDKYI